MALKMVKVVVIFLLSNPNRVTRILKKLFGNFTREQSGKNGILGEIRSRSHTLLGDYVNNINILFTRDLQPKRGLFHASSFAMTRKDDQQTDTRHRNSLTLCATISTHETELSSKLQSVRTFFLCYVKYFSKSPQIWSLIIPSSLNFAWLNADADSAKFWTLKFA